MISCGVSNINNYNSLITKKLLTPEGNVKHTFIEDKDGKRRKVKLLETRDKPEELKVKATIAGRKEEAVFSGNDAAPLISKIKEIDNLGKVSLPLTPIIFRPFNFFSPFDDDFASAFTDFEKYHDEFNIFSKDRLNSNDKVVEIINRIEAAMFSKSPSDELSTSLKIEEASEVTSNAEPVPAVQVKEEVSEEKVEVTTESITTAKPEEQVSAEGQPQPKPAIQSVQEATPAN